MRLKLKILTSTLVAALALATSSAQVQTPWDDLADRPAQVDAVANLSTNGMLARIASGQFAARTLTGTEGQITVTYGDGVGGNPVISLPSTITQAMNIMPDLGGSDQLVLRVSNNTASGGSTLAITRALGATGSARAAQVSFNDQWFAGILRNGGGAVDAFAIGAGSDRAVTPAHLALFGTGATGTVAVMPTTVSTSTSTGALTVAGGIGAAGAVWGASFNASSTANSDPQFVMVTNSGTGALAESSIYASNAGTSASAMVLQSTGTAYSATGGFFQDAGVVAAGTSLSGGLSIMARAASSDVRIYAGSHTNLVATFASGGATTLAGSLNITNGYLSASYSDSGSSDAFGTLSYTRMTSGTAANGFGQIFSLSLEDAAGSARGAFELRTTWEDAANYTAKTVLRTRNGVSGFVDALTLNATGTIKALSTIATAANVAWDLGAYTGGAPTPDGYLTVTVAGSTYRISADLQ